MLLACSSWCWWWDCLNRPAVFLVWFSTLAFQPFPPVPPQDGVWSTDPAVNSGTTEDTRAIIIGCQNTLSVAGSAHMQIAVFWNVVLFSLLDMSQGFRGTCWSILRSEVQWRQQVGLRVMLFKIIQFFNAHFPATWWVEFLMSDFQLWFLYIIK